MPDNEEKKIEFEAEDTDLDSLYDNEESDMFSEVEDEEDQDDEEKSSSKFESTPNNGRKNKIIMGAIAGIVALAIGVSAFKMVKQRKKQLNNSNSNNKVIQEKH